MNSLHSFGNGTAVEREERLPEELELGEALFGRELLPALPFFVERFFMARPAQRPLHGTTVAHDR
ncbi:MAG: hypothetical protein HYV09_02865 [Deltaproteobacteria bacterium]|nr:hypothetical protein [Deltaproteobacteria bacterium]